MIASASPATPISGQRLVALDFIRGVAVLGILIPNIIAFGQPFSAYMWPGGFLVPHGRVDDWLWVAQFVAVDGKMRGLFTLLFGAGLAVLADRAAARGQGAAPQLRRLGWLLVFGLAHFFLLWRGDILTLYALLGLGALPFARWPARRLLGLGLGAYALGAVLSLGSLATPFLVADTPLGDRPELASMRVELDAAMAAALADDAVETGLLTQGSYADFVAHNLAAHAGDPISLAFVYLFETWPLMLLGMALYRLGLFSGAIAPARLKRWGWAGVLGGTALTLPLALWLKATGLSYWGTLAGFLSLSLLPRLPVVLGLTALLALAAGRAQGSWPGRRLVAAGRMAFSNYLGTSVLMVVLFHPWGAGLWGELGRVQLYGVALLVWVLILAWSQPWLARFGIGPLEWLWRRLARGPAPGGPE